MCSICWEKDCLYDSFAGKLAKIIYLQDSLYPILFLVQVKINEVLHCLWMGLHYFRRSIIIKIFVNCLKQKLLYMIRHASLSSRMSLKRRRSLKGIKSEIYKTLVMTRLPFSFCLGYFTHYQYWMNFASKWFSCDWRYIMIVFDFVHIYAINLMKATI